MIYAVTATAKTPLSLRMGRNNTEAATIDHIPGSALFGALVNAYSTMYPGQTHELEELLFSETTRLGNLYPVDAKENAANPKQPVYPFPRTAHSCKRFGGFKSTANKTDAHGIHDHLIPLALFEMSNYQKPELLRERRLCEFTNANGLTCQEARSPQREGYYRRGETAGAWSSFEPKAMLRTHNGISRRRGTVQESILFSRSVMAAESVFWGMLRVDDDDHAVTLKQFVEEASQAGMIRVGSNRSRGMGRVELTLTACDPDTPEKLAGRLETFNQSLTQTAAAHEISLKYKRYVPITLTADAILIDHLLRYQSSLKAAYLAETHDLTGAELMYSNLSMRRIMGWNGLYQLPKADQLAVSKGSVFLFGFDSTIDRDLVEKLYNLQELGVGLHRREGYGQLLIANPFHWEVDKV